MILRRSEAHEKQVEGLKILQKLLSLHYPVPEDLKRFTLYAQLNQAEALKTAVTHWRSRMFKTSGFLIWQLDDCWPVISWSLIDYGLNPKPAYYFVKRAFQPVIAPLIIKDRQVYAYVVNETNKELELTLKFEVLRFNGETLHTENRTVTTPAYSALLTLDTSFEKLPIANDCILAVTLKDKGTVFYEDTKTVQEPKDLKLPKPKIQVDIKKVCESAFEISVESPVYAKAVHMDAGGLVGKFDDNFFDLIPDKKKTVKCNIECDCKLTDFKKAFTIQSYPYT